MQKLRYLLPYNHYRQFYHHKFVPKQQQQQSPSQAVLLFFQQVVSVVSQSQSRTFSSSTVSSSFLSSNKTNESSKEKQQPQPNYSFIPPQYPLPILKSSSSSSSSISSKQAPPSLTSSSVTQQIQHFLKRNCSIPYQQNVIIQGETLFQSALQQSQLPEWYGPGRIGRDFRSRHAVLTFHIWLLHKRLLVSEEMNEDGTKNSTSNETMTPKGLTRKDYNMCKDIDMELFNILWDNTTCRIRALNVYELSVNKHLQNVQHYTFLHLVQYDHCYSDTMLQNPTERLNYLRELVAQQWLRPKAIDKRNKAYDKGIHLTDEDLYTDDIEDVYRNTCHHIDRIVHYIDAQYCNMIMDLPYEHFTNGHVRYVPPPTFANLHDVSSAPSSGSGTISSNNNKIDGGDNNSDDADVTTIMANVPFAEYPNTPIPCHPDDVLPHPWVANITNGGKTYYWNTITNVSSWTRP